VDVRDGLTGLGAGVEDDPVTGLGHALGRRDLPDCVDHLAEQRGVRGGERRHVGVMRLGYDQDMRRGLRVDVAEGQDPVRFKHLGGGDFARHDGAEQAISHRKILGLPGHAYGSSVDLPFAVAAVPAIPA